MKVAFVHDYLNQSGGAERVLKALCELFPEAPIFTLIYDKKETNGEFEDKRIVTSFLQRIPGVQKHHRVFPLLMPLAVKHLNVGAYDLIISDSECFGKGVLKNSQAIHISYCHTPARFLWDGYQAHLAQSRLPRIIKFLAPLALTYLRVWDIHTIEHVDYFLANSQFIADRIRKYYRREARVIYPPVSLNAFKATNKKETYYLLLMRLVPYKKPEIVIEAFNALGLPLKVVGDGPLFNRLRRRAEKNIEFIGRVAHSEVAPYYGKARALIFPQEEDFGISAVESCASGTPVIAFGRGGIREIVTEGLNGIFFNEQTPQGLMRAVKAFQKMKFNGKVVSNSVSKFDEARFKREVMETIHDLGIL